MVGGLLRMEKFMEELSVKKENLNEVMFEPLLVDNKNFEEIIYTLENLYQSINQARDTITITFSDKSGEEKEYIKFENEFSEIRKNLQGNIKEFLNRAELIEEDFFLCEIYISKKEKKSQGFITISIYDLKIFLLFLTYNDDRSRKLNVNEILGKLKRYFYDTEAIYLFDLFNDDIQLRTDHFIFSSKLGQLKKENLTIEKKNIANLTEYTNISPLPFFSPSDFFVKESQENIGLTEVFDRLCLLLSLSSLANISVLEDDTLNIKFYGQKTVVEEINFSTLVTNKDIVNSFYEIYCWVFYNKDSHEKISLTRNIITLFYDGNSVFNNIQNILPSIKSNYEIYLKENVDRYVQILNNVVLLIQNLDTEIQDKATAFSDDFKKNFTSFFTFIISTILFNTLSTGKIENIFTPEITIITVAMLIISIIYLIISNFEINNQIDQLNEQYEKNKKYYSSILNEKDIERIFANGMELSKAIMVKKRKNILFLWISSIIIIFITLMIIGDFSLLIDAYNNLLSSLAKIKLI